MNVYKFGGAALSSSSSVKDVRRIVISAPKPLTVIVSAIGKTTNALEAILESVVRGDEHRAVSGLSALFDHHDELITGLKLPSGIIDDLKEELQAIILQYSQSNPLSYAQLYDIVVGYGELLSSAIMAAALCDGGLSVKHLDMRQLMVTDNRFRAANVDSVRASQRLSAAIDGTADVYLGQGFVGGTLDGEPTTLGREGSDYSAAMAAFALDAESLTIWKDVAGILSADPALFDSAELVPHLSYNDAVELAYSGAKVIHPKTIRPLQNKGIPLYVRSFTDLSCTGSVIDSRVSNIAVPIVILKKRQVLLSVSPRDFSFALEHSMERFFSILNRHRITVGIIQTSALQISVAIDEPRDLISLVDELGSEFAVRYNRGLELLTIRGYREADIASYTNGSRVFVKQQTRRIVRILKSTT